MTDPRQFVSGHTGQDSWARDLRALDCWRRGTQASVLPRTMEWFLTMDCNANCPSCSFFDARHEGWRGLTAMARPDDSRTVTYASATHVINEIIRAGVTGILITGGGEPTTHPDLPAIMEHIAARQLVQALYTNGFLLAESNALAQFLFRIALGLVFVRLSINAASPDVVRRHWGIKDGEIFPRQLQALRNLFRARAQYLEDPASRGLWVPSIQISTIVDETTAGDLEAIADGVAATAAPFAHTSQPDDCIIVRPSTDHQSGEYSNRDHAESLPRRVLDVFGQSGSARKMLETAGIRVALGFGLGDLERGRFRTYADVLAAQYCGRSPSWATGLFLTVGPDGCVYPCTEMGGDRQWILGNLRRQTVDEVYHSPERARALRIFEGCGWGPALFQPFGRSQRLDRIARALRSGHLDDEGIEAARVASLNSPPLLLN